VIERRAAPRFRTAWTTGLGDLPALGGRFWTDEGHGEEDAITLHAFHWEGPAPDQATFEALMREAVREDRHLDRPPAVRPESERRLFAFPGWRFLLRHRA
jgi:hypothetical protein